MSWFADRRLDFIEDRLVRHRRVNRAEIITYFQVSAAVASGDIQAYLQANPHVDYDKSAKCYVAGRNFMPVRRSRADRRNAWAVWDPANPLDANRCDCEACRGADAKEKWGETWQLRMFEGMGR